MSPSSVGVSGFRLKSSIHFEFIFVQAERLESFVLLYFDIQFPGIIFFKNLSFFSKFFFFLTTWSKIKAGAVFIPGSSGLVFHSACLFLQQYHAVLVFMMV